MGNKRDGDSCYDAAEVDEPMFVLLARDVQAPGLVEAWSDEREALVAMGQKPAEDMAKVEEARAQAKRMREWRAANR